MRRVDLYEIRQQLSSGKSIYDIPLRVAYYARVSTDKDAQIHSLGAQIQYYEDFIRSINTWEFFGGYVDEGLSGTSVDKRDSFLSMIEDAKLHKFDFIVTKEISRFSRSTLDSIRYTQELLRSGVGVLFQSDNINTLMPDAELRLTIMSSIAQDEVRKLSERVRFGFKRSIEKGIVLGNDKIWGYKKDNGKLVIVRQEAEMVKDIFDMYANQRLGLRTIAARLSEKGLKNTRGNDFTFSTIKGIITNPKYMGYYCGNKTHKIDYRHNDRKYLDSTEWVLYKDEKSVPPIVSEELWQKANDILLRRSEKLSSEDRTSYQNKYKYSGKVICGEHNVPYYRTVYRYKSGNKELWQCRKYTEKGREGCEMPNIYTAELDMIMKEIYDTVVTEKAAIINDLMKIYSDIGGSSQITADKAQVQTDINTTLAMKDKLLDLSLKGRIGDDEFEQRNNRFNLQIESLRRRLEELKMQEIKNRELTAGLENLRKLIANELDFENGLDDNLIDSLVDKMVVYNGENKNEIHIKVYLKLLPDERIYRINRGRKITSVCNEQHT